MTQLTRSPCDEGVIQSGAPPRATAGNGPWILAATILGSSMVFINGSTVNVALPALQRSLGATVVDIQWIVNGYTLMLAALILLGGSLGDHYGRRRIFVAGVMAFTLASIWCGLAPTTGQLILARVAQGVGGAMLTPGSLAIISASFGEAERGRAIGLWAGFSALTSAVGPLLGGWLIDTFSWRWIFFIHVPLAALTLLITLTRVPESRDEEVVGGLDWVGALLATAGLASLTYGLVESSNVGLADPTVIGTIVGGGLLLALFVVVERRIASPMVPLALFGSSTFSGANLLTLFLYTALSGALFFLPMNLIQVQGYSATAAGAAFAPMILLMSLLSSWAGGLVNRVGARLPLVVGPLIAAVGFFLFTRAGIGGSYWTGFFPALLVLGLGMAISVAPLTTAVMSSVATHYAGTASGINNAVSRVASLLAVALFGILILSTFGGELERGLDEVTLAPAARQAIEDERTSLAEISLPATLDPSVRATVDGVINRAFVTGYNRVMWLSVALAVASAAVAWRTIDPRVVMDEG